jgi:hypothetical protein
MHAVGSKNRFSADGLFIGSGYTADHQAESLDVSDFPDDVLESEEVFSAF